LSLPPHLRRSCSASWSFRREIGPGGRLQILGAVADAALLRQLIHTWQADACLPAVEEQEALDLLGQFELNYLPTLAPAAVRNHGKNIGDGAMG